MVNVVIAFFVVFLKALKQEINLKKSVKWFTLFLQFIIKNLAYAKNCKKTVSASPKFLTLFCHKNITNKVFKVIIVNLNNKKVCVK